jgi:DNA-binding response OmpR family regulator
MDSKQAHRILVVDDEVTARVSLVELLRLQGYHVSMASSGEEALELIDSQPAFDLMVLDLKMPGMDGLQVTEAVNKRSPDTVIILLTAFGTLDTAIQAIRRGAHDYLLKPCPVQQILASVRAGLVKLQREQHRRELMDHLEHTLSELVSIDRGEEEAALPSVSAVQNLQVREVELNRERHAASVNGKPVHLTPTEFKLLAHLMENAGQVCSPQELVRRAQGYDSDPWGARAIIRVHIRRLRRKLEPDPVSPRYIVNVRGVGYTFPTEPAPEESSAQD